MALPNPTYTWSTPQWAQRPVPSPTPPTPNTFEWIRGGEAAVNAYQVQPGNTVRLMDADNPVLYVKTVDFTGKPYVETYDLVLRTNKVEEASGGYEVKMEEIQQMISDAVKKEFNKYNKPRKPQRKEDEHV